MIEIFSFINLWIYRKNLKSRINAKDENPIEFGFGILAKLYINIDLHQKDPSHYQYSN